MIAKGSALERRRRVELVSEDDVDDSAEKGRTGRKFAFKDGLNREMWAGTSATAESRSAQARRMQGVRERNCLITVVERENRGGRTRWQKKRCTVHGPRSGSRQLSNWMTSTLITLFQIESLPLFCCARLFSSLARSVWKSSSPLPTRCRCCVVVKNGLALTRHEQPDSHRCSRQTQNTLLSAHNRCFQKCRPCRLCRRQGRGLHGLASVCQLFASSPLDDSASFR
jgi:hypothetical protein